MYNLNPRYAMINHDIDYMKQKILDMDYKTLLDLCPRIRIPINTLFYHSTKLSSKDIFTTKDILYPEFGGCKKCQYNLPIPKENIGDKPRIMELSSNPNKKVGNRCECLVGQQKRLYGNFNFAGNYSLSLGKTILKGTEILINDKEIILIDLNYISAELGFSPKRFFMGKDEKNNGFAKQAYWQSYCQSNGIDGIIMVDIVDVQNINLCEKTILSCYNHVNPYNEKEGVACPEFVLIAPIGAKINENPIGTEKLKILGMVDLYDELNNDKLTRDNVDKLFYIYFNNLYNALNTMLNNVTLNLTYYESFTVFKQLTINYNNKILNTDEILYVVKKYINMYGTKQEFYVNINDYNNVNSDNIVYTSDKCYLREYNAKQLELFEPAILSKHVELFTDIIVNNILPKNSKDFYFKNNSLVTRYASDLIFDYILYNIYNFDFNKMLYTNYYLLSAVKNYEKYTMDYFHDSIYKKGFVENNVKNFINNLEKEIIANFYIGCYIIINNLQLNNDFYKILYDQMLNYLENNKFDYTPFRTNWIQFTSYLPIQPEKYVCNIRNYQNFITEVISYDNFMIRYLYHLLQYNGYIIDISINEIINNLNDNINLFFFNLYTKNINDLEKIYEVYNNKIQELFYMI